MGGDQRQPAAGQVTAQQLHQPLERGLIEAVRRLIEEPQETRHQSEPRQRQAALLSGRKQGRRIIGKAGKVAPIPVELRPLERTSNSLDDLRAGRIVGRVVITP